MKTYMIKIEKCMDKNNPIVKAEQVGTKPPKTPIWFQLFEKRNNSRLDRIESRLDNIDVRLTKVENTLNRVINLNNLKH